MSRLARKKLADLAIGAMSGVPHSLDVFSADGGVVTLDLLGREANHLVAHAPRLRVRPQLELHARTHTTSGGGFDIRMVVADLFDAGEGMATLHLQVVDVTPRESHRTLPRAEVKELALLHVLGGRALTEGEEFDVRLADLSPAGVAFITEQRFYIGDRFALMVSVEGRLLRLQARVLQTTGFPWGRIRVGCEIVQIGDADRERIAELTEKMPHRGTQEQRLRRTA
jgi:PilZ domain-containing protein